MRKTFLIVLVVIILIGLIVYLNRSSFAPRLPQSSAPPSITPLIVTNTVAPRPSATMAPEIIVTSISPSQSFGQDTTPPLAYILTPANNEYVERGMSVKIVANVTDNVKVDRVEFFVGSGDYLKLGTIYDPPYEAIWTIDDRWHSVNIPIYVKAYDKAGNKASNPETMINVIMRN